MVEPTATLMCILCLRLTPKSQGVESLGLMKFTKKKSMSKMLQYAQVTNVVCHSVLYTIGARVISHKVVP